ncbi:AAA family ATPase [Tritonibacter scottomollicae]|uniref:AAA family ATPase n=1 Tax=Tritonibacter scottomollicae TaxID=483013 RepID=UPI003AA7B7B3
MTKIKFIDARFPDGGLDEMGIKRRFEGHLRKLRALRDGVTPQAPDDFADALRWEGDLSEVRISSNDRNKILRRAQYLVQRRDALSGTNHLSSDDKRKLAVLRNGVDLVQIKTEHRADEIAAAIQADMPWMAPATDFLWKAMRRSVHVGEPGFRLPPVLLDGPPGIGKSMWSRQLGRHLGVPRSAIEGTAEQASFVINGSQKGWGTTFPGRPIQTILQNLCANPIIVIDEIEKAGKPTSTNGQTYGLQDGLLPLLERSSAATWKCPYFQINFDMSWISWVLTSNSLATLSAPFLSRLEVLRLSQVSSAHLSEFARREGHKRGLSQPSVDALVEALEIANRTDQLNLRHVIRMLERGQVLEAAGTLH